jgi:hypothetical protein
MIYHAGGRRDDSSSLDNLDHAHRRCEAKVK